MSLDFKTKSEVVYERLRHDIIDGKLKPGERIVISDLSDELGVSETPIREAIRRLESERLLDITPHVGPIVTKIDEKEVTEIYVIRIELESLATRLAAPYLRKADFDFLDKKIQQMELAIGQQNYEKLGLLNKDFHLRIYRAAPYVLLFKLIEDLWERVQRTRSVFALVPERALASLGEHKRIVEALRSRNSDLVGRLVKEQKGKSMKALVDFLEESGKLARFPPGTVNLDRIEPDLAEFWKAESHK
ncbi:MAG: GntR family transcriptional regulator [Planctomycetota bacterium]|jgi:DNA-binding GntR family transcriptional regulator